MPRRKVNVKQTILKYLYRNGQATWTQLTHNAKISKAALSNHITKLIKLGEVERVVDQQAKPPKVYYQIPKSKHFSFVFTTPSAQDTRPWLSNKTEADVIPLFFELLAKTEQGKEVARLILETELLAIKKLVLQAIIAPEDMNDILDILRFWILTFNEWLHTSPETLAPIINQLYEDNENKHGNNIQVVAGKIAELVQKNVVEGKVTNREVKIKIPSDIVKKHGLE